MKTFNAYSYVCGIVSESKRIQVRVSPAAHRRYMELDESPRKRTALVENVVERYLMSGDIIGRAAPKTRTDGTQSDTVDFITRLVAAGSEVVIRPPTITPKTIRAEIETDLDAEVESTNIKQELDRDAETMTTPEPTQEPVESTDTTQELDRDAETMTTPEPTQEPVESTDTTQELDRDAEAPIPMGPVKADTTETDHESNGLESLIEHVKRDLDKAEQHAATIREAKGTYHADYSQAWHERDAIMHRLHALQQQLADQKRSESKKTRGGLFSRFRRS